MQSIGTAPARSRPRRKVHPVLWFLLALVLIVVLLAIAVAGIGYYVAGRFESDPGGATASLLRTIELGFDVTSSEGNRLTLRDRDTGQVTTLKLTDLKNTIFRFGSDGIELIVQDATHKIAIGGGSLPDWIPPYPGAKVRRTLSASEGDSAGAQVFRTRDGASSVLTFYEQAFTNAGMQVARPSTDRLLAQSAARQVSVKADWDGDTATVAISYSAKP